MPGGEGERGPVLVNAEQKADLRLRKIACHNPQEPPPIENRDGWGSRIRDGVKA